MLDENTRNAIALKRFSLISPVLNGQVSNNKSYYSTVTEKPIDMPYYGARKYSPKTVESWYCDYMRGGIDALKPHPRGDKGGSRRINEELGAKIIEKKAMHPKAPKTVIYELLINDGVIDPAKISISTLYRYLKAERLKTSLAKDEEEKEMKRFSHEFINQLWQSDVMYGPFIKDGKKRRQTYLFAYLDDASRLVTHAQFYFSQSFESLRDSFKQALLKRGFPTMIFTDNGKIYRSQQFELVCASLGCSLIHSRPYEPNSRGKVERLFLTVRKRFLSTLDLDSIKDIDDLNKRLFKWLDEDYHKKVHSSLNGLSPLDFFMSQVDRVKLCNDPKSLDEKFLLRKKRKVSHDGTFSIDNILFETKIKFAGMQVEIRYEPVWLETPFRPVFIYSDDKKVGEALQVNFHDNAHMKRKGRPPSNSPSKDNDIKKTPLDEPPVEQTISFTQMMEEDN
ncbi:IS481 family transposase [Desulfitibacter alkalitolerans]|uniref:IS481 family transposase n=1 Tax=Desulfitibacter alkalitolerans TaxID=264641 RepID=UPI0004872ECF|nr:IS481 family transposase [Desulfitibacter alkalitolerans]